MIPDIFYNVNVNLNVTYPAVPSYGTGMSFVDHADIPIYDRVRVVDFDGVSDLTAGGAAHTMATAFYGQEEKAERLYLVRNPRTAIPPAFICGTYTTTPATWAALGTGTTFTVTDSSSNSTVVTLGDLSGVTAFSQVLTVLNAGLAALVTPDVVGLDDATFGLDINGDLVLTMPAGQDDTDPTIAITPSAVNTTPTYHMGVQAAGDGTSVSGNAVETLLESYTAAKLLYRGYNLSTELRGGTDDDIDNEMIALAAQVQTERAQTTFVDQSSDAINPAVATDLHSRLKALGYDQSTVIYTTQSDYPDLCADGAWLPADAGSRSFGHTKLTGCLASGDEGAENDLSTSDRTALEDKGCNYVVLTTAGNLFVHRGNTVTGINKRLIRFVHWFEAAIQADLEALDMSEDVLGFDAPTLGAINGILETRLREGVEDRKALISYEITLPTVDDFTASDIASGDMSISKAFRAVGRIEAQTFRLVGNIGLK